MSAPTASDKPQNHVMRGIVFAALGGICWGFSGTCAQLLTNGYDIPVSWITSVRLTAAAILFLTVCAFKNWRTLRAALRDVRSLLYIAGFSILGVLLTQVSYLSAIAYTNAGIGTVLERLGIVVIMVYVCVRVKRLPKLRECAGLVLAMAGVFLIATQGDIGSLAIPAQGLFWGLISAIALAFYTLMPVKPLAKWGSFIVTGIAMLMGSIVSTTVVQPWNMDVAVSIDVVLIMAAMVLIGTFGAYLFYLQGINDAGSVRASLVGCVEPVSAMVISSVWLGTAVTGFDIAGTVLIIVMVVLTTQRGGDEDRGRYAGSLRDLPVFQGAASLLGYYRARHATVNDFNDFQAVLETGHATMAELGVDEKDEKKYPSERRVMRAIDRRCARVVIMDVEALAHDAQGIHGESENPHETTAGGSGDLLEATASGSIEIDANTESVATSRNATNKAEKTIESVAGTRGAERIIGVFSVDTLGDASYAKATGAQWHSADDDYVALHWVTVIPDARRSGVGSFILGETERIAKEAGKHAVRADCYESNAPMRALLESRGYTHCGTITLRNSLGKERRRAAYERIW